MRLPKLQWFPVTNRRGCDVVSLKVSDIESERMVIRVEQGKGRKDRYALLSEFFPSQFGPIEASRPRSRLLDHRAYDLSLTAETYHRLNGSCGRVKSA